MAYYKLEKHLETQNQNFLKSLNVDNIKNNFCNENYDVVLREILPGIIIAGNTEENQKKFSELIHDTITKSKLNAFVKTTVLATLANLIACKFSLDGTTCSELKINFMPTEYSLYEKESQESQIWSTEEGMVGGPDIYIPIDKEDTIYHEFSHFLDNRMNIEGSPWYPNDENSQNELLDLGKIVNFKGSYTEYVAYAVTNTVRSFYSKKLSNVSKNFNEIGQWRLDHVFKKDCGILIHVTKSICDRDTPIWNTLGKLLNVEKESLLKSENTQKCYDTQIKDELSIPEAINLPFRKLLTIEERLKTIESLKECFKGNLQHSIDLINALPQQKEIYNKAKTADIKKEDSYQVIIEKISFLVVYLEDEEEIQESLGKCSDILPSKSQHYPEIRSILEDNTKLIVEGIINYGENDDL